MMLYGHSEQDSKSVMHYSYRNQPMVLYRRTYLDGLLRTALIKREIGSQLVQAVDEWLSGLFDLLMLDYFRQIEGCFKNLYQKLDSCHSNTHFPAAIWQEEIHKIEIGIRAKVLKRLSKGEKIVDSNYIRFLEDEIQNLQPLSEFVVHSDKNASVHMHESFQMLQQQMEQMFKSNNRVTFKMMQELIEKMEMLGTASLVNQETNIEEMMKGQEQKLVEMQRVAIEIFDMFELVYQSALQSNNTIWSDELEGAINKILALLKQHGICEIPVLGELIDGAKMETIGRVSLDHLPDGHKQYEVYAVHQRAFMDQQSEKVIRKAKVTTVY